VVERAAGTLRVLTSTDPYCRPWLPGTVDRFSFTTDPENARVARELGARVTDGFLTVLALTTSWQCPPGWFVESGDRI
jgi:acyl dehydratase